MGIVSPPRPLPHLLCVLCWIAWLIRFSDCSTVLFDYLQETEKASICDAQPQLLRSVTRPPKLVDGILCICANGKLHAIIPTRFGCVISPKIEVCIPYECTSTAPLTTPAPISAALIFVPFSKSNPGNLFHVLFDELYPVWCSLERIRESSELRLNNWLIFPVDPLTTLQYQALSLLFQQIGRVPASPTDVLVGTHSECRLIQGESLQLPESFNMSVLISSPESNGAASADFAQFIQAIVASASLSPISFNRTNSILLLSRSNARRRRLVNEPECALMLAQLAQAHHFRFEYVTNLSEISLHEQIRLVSSAKMVIGVHGAALSLASFLPEGSVVVEIFPERFWRSTFQLVSQQRKLTHVSLWSSSNREYHQFCVSQLVMDPARRLQCLRDADGWMDLALLHDTVREFLVSI